MNSLTTNSITISTEDDMIAFGRELGAALPPRALVFLTGNLGAGKTTLTKGIAEGLHAAPASEVSSPTFTLIHEYGDPVRLYHIDLYRLEEPRQLASLGLEEILDRNAVIVIEWPEKFERWLPPEHYTVTISRQGDSRVLNLAATPALAPLPAILCSASIPMDAHSDSGICQDTFALVAYIPEPLGRFLNELRSRVDPGSDPNAHVTLLPPRHLSGSPEQASLQLHEFLRDVPAFELEIAEVGIFESTHVVFLQLGQGRRCLQEIHAALNVGALHSAEPHPYHPHITIVQHQPAPEVPARAEEARQSWAAYPGPRRFPVTRLTFVKHIGGNLWQDLDSFDLNGDPTQTT